MAILDDAGAWQKADPSSLHQLLVSLPDQLRTAAAMEIEQGGIASDEPPANVVVCGMGGSAIGGDVALSAIGEHLRVPLVVHRGYRLPPFAGPKTLVIASSYSGNTEETLSAYLDALRVGSRLACIASGGALAQHAREKRLPLCLIPGNLPPRAALGYSCVMILKLLESAGLTPGMAEDLQETIEVTSSLAQKLNRGVRTTDNRAKRLAASMHGRVSAIYSSDRLAAAAYRWRCQIEENAKNLALHHVLPEMNHNELVGWALPQAVLRKIAAVFLRDQDDHPQVQRRIEWTREYVSGKAAETVEVWSEGRSRLARVFSVIYWGDFVSLYLAYLNLVDPTPVAVIEALKQELTR
ncbi:MAG: bifunctional phosphoglucose/phosphomannose isomerase [Acidobacteria bacterium]|nr:bifunctional phosphoglucose/phosphomannose isomerase [Acidobacteriota bacterium]